MMRNYLGFFGLWWLAVWPAQAAEVLVGDLALRCAPPCERALAAEEDAEDSAILRWPVGEVTVFLPRQPVALKTEEARFYRQLEQHWRALYGADLRIYPMEVAGTTWRVSRRPSLGRDATVFQLVHVHAGRAHHLLAIAAGRVEALPEVVQRLLATARWGEPVSLVLGPSSREDLALQEHVLVPAPPAGGPVTAEAPPPMAAALPGPGAPPLVAAIPTTPATPPAVARAPAEPLSRPPDGPVPLAPAAAPPSPAPQAKAPSDGAWRLARVVHALPRGARLAELAEAETRRLGEGGVLTGYGLSRREQGPAGFVEGYRWQEVAGQRPLRQAFARHWQLDGQPPRELRPGDLAWSWILVEAGREGLGEGVAGPVARLEMRAVCGPRRDLVAAFDALEKGLEGAGERLAGLARACPQHGAVAPAATLTLQPGAAARASLALSAPWAEPTAGRAGVVKRLVVTLSYPADGPGPGDSLLAGTRSHYIYVPPGE